GQGALPLGTKLGRTLRTRFVWVWEGAYSAIGIGTVGPLPNPDRMDSKGSAFGGGSRGAKPPWPSFNQSPSTLRACRLRCARLGDGRFGERAVDLLDRAALGLDAQQPEGARTER